jgi:predicted O-methyltransferase YrrM
VSVEHDPAWFARVSTELERSGLANVDLRLVAADAARYVAPLGELAPGSLDFVLVDGLHRLECIRESLGKLAPGGLLVLDDSERMPRGEWGVPDDWPVEHESTSVMKKTTTIWRKPS